MMRSASVLASLYCDCPGYDFWVGEQWSLGLLARASDVVGVPAEPQHTLLAGKKRFDQPTATDAWGQRYRSGPPSMRRM
jgi:hypothetical protein